MIKTSYKGYIIDNDVGIFWIEGLPSGGPIFTALPDAIAYIDTTLLGINTDGSETPNDYFMPARNNWVGNLEKADVARENKLIALGPAPPGMAGQLEGLLLLLFLRKLSETPEGVKTIERLATRYLQEVGQTLRSLSLSSSANPYNCIINDYVAVRIFQRLGMISAHDAVQTAAWLDHCLGQMINKNYFSDTLTGLTSMVTGLERAIPTVLK